MADSAAEPIDPALARKLDAFTVPRLPEGFAARAAAAAMALPQDGPALPELPRQRRAMSRRWLGRGLGGLGVLTVGMLSISAAAMGYFGEPMREAVGKAPVIGKVIERVIPERLRHRREHAQLAARAETPVVAPSASASPEVVIPPPGPRPFMGPGRFASPEERRAWMQAHPVQAARIAERRREWAEAHPLQAERLAERRAWAEAHPEEAAARRAAIQQRRMELRRRRMEAGMAGPAGADQAMPMGPGPQQAWRMERRERLRAWREERRRMMQGEGPGPQPPM